MRSYQHQQHYQQQQYYGVDSYDSTRGHQRYRQQQQPATVTAHAHQPFASADVPYNNSNSNGPSSYAYAPPPAFPYPQPSAAAAVTAYGYASSVSASPASGHGSPTGGVEQQKQQRQFRPSAAHTSTTAGSGNSFAVASGGGPKVSSPSMGFGVSGVSAATAATQFASVPQIRVGGSTLLPPPVAVTTSSFATNNKGSGGGGVAVAATPMIPLSVVSSAVLSASPLDRYVDARRFRTSLCRHYLAATAEREKEKENTEEEAAAPPFLCPYEANCMFAHSPLQLRTAEQNEADGLTTEEAVKAFKIRERENEKRLAIKKKAKDKAKAKLHAARERRRLKEEAEAAEMAAAGAGGEEGGVGPSDASDGSDAEEVGGRTKALGNVPSTAAAADNGDALVLVGAPPEKKKRNRRKKKKSGATAACAAADDSNDDADGDAAEAIVAGVTVGDNNTLGPLGTTVGKELRRNSGIVSNSVSQPLQQQQQQHKKERRRDRNGSLHQPLYIPEGFAAAALLSAGAASPHVATATAGAGGGSAVGAEGGDAVARGCGDGFADGGGAAPRKGIVHADAAALGPPAPPHRCLFQHPSALAAVVLEDMARRRREEAVGGGGVGGVSAATGDEGGDNNGNSCGHAPCAEAAGVASVGAVLPSLSNASKDVSRDSIAAVPQSNASTADADADLRSPQIAIILTRADTSSSFSSKSSSSSSCDSNEGEGEEASGGGVIAHTASLAAASRAASSLHSESYPMSTTNVKKKKAAQRGTSADAHAASACGGPMLLGAYGSVMYASDTNGVSSFASSASASAAPVGTSPRRSGSGFGQPLSVQQPPPPAFAEHSFGSGGGVGGLEAPVRNSKLRRMQHQQSARSPPPATQVEVYGNSHGACAYGQLDHPPAAYNGDAELSGGYFGVSPPQPSSYLHPQSQPLNSASAHASHGYAHHGHSAAAAGGGGQSATGNSSFSSLLAAPALYSQRLQQGGGGGSSNGSTCGGGGGGAGPRSPLHPSSACGESPFGQSPVSPTTLRVNSSQFTNQQQQQRLGLVSHRPLQQHSPHQQAGGHTMAGQRMGSSLRDGVPSQNASFSLCTANGQQHQPQSLPFPAAAAAAAAAGGGPSCGAKESPFLAFHTRSRTFSDPPLSSSGALPPPQALQRPGGGSKQAAVPPLRGRSHQRDNSDGYSYTHGGESSQGGAPNDDSRGFGGADHLNVFQLSVTEPEAVAAEDAGCWVAAHPQNTSATHRPRGHSGASASATSQLLLGASGGGGPQMSSPHNRSLSNSSFLLGSGGGGGGGAGAPPRSPRTPSGQHMPYGNLLPRSPPAPSLTGAQ